MCDGDRELLVDLPAMKRNLDRLRSRLPIGSPVIAMVKSHGYGTDAKEICRYLKTVGVNRFGLAYLDEALTLRQEGVDGSLFLTYVRPEEASEVVKHHLEATIQTVELIEAFDKVKHQITIPVPVHLNLNTGMNRFGCIPKEGLKLARMIAERPYLKLEGVMTHFAASEDPKEDRFTIRQAENLQRAVELFRSEGIHPRYVHAANSAGVMRFHFPHFTMARIGIALFGIHPSDESQQCCPLEPVITLRSKLVRIFNCRRGDTVSYGRRYTVQKENERIGVVPLGYADGILRRVEGEWYVLVHGKHAAIRGSVCMDYFMIDLTDIPEAKVGDQVIVYGADGTGEVIYPEKIAKQGGAIPHEMVVTLGRRIKKIFIGK